MNRLSRLLFIALALGFGTAPASAHHSGAMFDRTKSVVIKGTLKEVQWINPHAWILVLGSPNGDKPVLWSFELGGGGAALKRMGMTRTFPRIGDKVAVKGYPLRDGRPGASFVSMTLADGHVFAQILQLPGGYQSPGTTLSSH